MPHFPRRSMSMGLAHIQTRRSDSFGRQIPGLETGLRTADQFEQCWSFSEQNRPDICS